jgi:cell division protein FtsB
VSAPARTPPRTPTRAPARPGGRTTATGPVHVPVRRTGPVHSRTQLRVVPDRTGATRPAGRTRRSPLTSRRAPFVVLVVVLLVATTLGLLLLNTAIAVDSLEATQQRAANAEQAEEVARLEQQVVTAETAAELARAATAAGLVPPGAAAHLVLQPDGTSVLLGTPVPADSTPGN